MALVDVSTRAPFEDDKETTDSRRPLRIPVLVYSTSTVPLCIVQRLVHRGEKLSLPRSQYKYIERCRETVLYWDERTCTKEKEKKEERRRKVQSCTVVRQLGGAAVIDDTSAYILYGGHVRRYSAVPPTSYS